MMARLLLHYKIPKAAAIQLLKKWEVIESNAVNVT